MRRCKRYANRTIGLSLVAMLVVASAALTAQQKLEGRVSAGRVNVRLEPVDGALIVAKLSPEDVVDVLEEHAGWVKVAVSTDSGERRTGFVARRLIDIKVVRVIDPRGNGTPESVATAAAANAPAVPPGAAAPPPPTTNTPQVSGSELAGQTLHAAIHPGRAEDPAYWRQVVKVLKVLENRHRDRFNLVTPVLGNELSNMEGIVPKRSKDKDGDVAQYRLLAIGILANIDPGGNAIDWRQTLAGVEPEKSFISRWTKRVTSVAIHGMPLPGIARKLIPEPH